MRYSMRGLFFTLISVVLTSAFAAENTSTNLESRVMVWPAMAFAAPVLSGRCAQVIGCSAAKDYGGCFASSGTFADQFQKRAGRGAMFEDHLDKIGKDPETVAYLKYLNTLLDDKSKHFNLWTVTMQNRWVKEDKRKAMQILGSIFQDSKYSSASLSPETEQLKNQVMKKLYKRMGEGSLDALPPGVAPKQCAIYHFYSTGLIAQEMAATGVPPKYAAGLSYSMNESYEAGSSLFKKSDNSADIFCGYAGTQFALSPEKKKYSDISYAEFKEGYGQDGASFVAKSFQDSLGGSEQFCNGTTSYDTYKAKNPIPVPRPSDSGSLMKVINSPARESTRGSGVK